ncbi:MAG TPA: kelch repeat-containing protein [Acidimicrobiia bacterium]|jgi:hypothetical protein
MRPRRALALASVLGLLGLVLSASGLGSAATAAAATTPPYQLVTRPSGALSGRVFTAMAGDTDGSSVVLYGGETPGDATDKMFGDTWVYQPGTGWVAKCGSTTIGASAACGPGPRSTAGMGSGPSGPVLFGGSPTGIDGGGGALPSDTWVWTHGAWTQACADGACGPSGRVLPGVGGNGSQVVMFGGLGGSGVPDDTWVFDGHTWTQTCGTGAAVPCGAPPLVGPAIGWDGHQFVMFGGAPVGSGDIGAPTDDTWTFDGTRWTQVCGTSIGTPCGPAAKALASMTFQKSPTAALQGAVLAGGGALFGGGSQHLDREVWRYTDGAWTKLPTPWPSTTVAFSDGAPPPSGQGPLIAVVAARPADCQILFLGQDPVRNPDFNVTPLTASGGWDADASGQPEGCVADPAGTPVTPVTAPASPAAATTGAPSALPATGAGSSGTTASMARTGRSSERLALAGLVAVLLGSIGVVVGRKRRAPLGRGVTA